MFSNQISSMLEGYTSLNNVSVTSATTVDGTGFNVVNLMVGNSISGGLNVVVMGLVASGTSVVGTFKVQHSDDNVTFVDAPAACVLDRVTGNPYTIPTLTNAAATLGYTPFLVSGATGALKAFVRISLTVAGTSPAVRATAIIEGRARYDNVQTNYAV